MEKENNEVKEKVTGVFDRASGVGAIKIDATKGKPVAEEIIPQLRKTIAEANGIPEEQASVMAKQIFDDIEKAFEERQSKKIAGNLDDQLTQLADKLTPFFDELNKIENEQTRLAMAVAAMLLRYGAEKV